MAIIARKSEKLTDILSALWDRPVSHRFYLRMICMNSLFEWNIPKKDRMGQRTHTLMVSVSGPAHATNIFSTYFSNVLEKKTMPFEMMRVRCKVRKACDSTRRSLAVFFFVVLASNHSRGPITKSSWRWLAGVVCHQYEEWYKRCSKLL